MPIKPEMRDRYPTDWAQIRVRILDRDGHCCKFCGVPNHTVIWRGTLGDIAVWGDPARTGIFYNAEDGTQVYDGFAVGEDEGRHVRIVLTIAHLDDPDPANCADSNLAALCQRCHNLFDAPMRRLHAAQTRRARRALGDLFTS